MVELLNNASIFQHFKTCFTKWLHLLPQFCDIRHITASAYDSKSNFVFRSELHEKYGLQVFTIRCWYNSVTLWLCHLQVLTAMWRLHARPLGLDTTNKTFSILHCCNLNYGTYFWRRISLALKTKRDTLWLITKWDILTPMCP